MVTDKLFLWFISCFNSYIARLIIHMTVLAYYKQSNYTKERSTAKIIIIIMKAGASKINGIAWWFILDLWHNLGLVYYRAKTYFSPLVYTWLDRMMYLLFFCVVLFKWNSAEKDSWCLQNIQESMLFICLSHLKEYYLFKLLQLLF